MKRLLYLSLAAMMVLAMSCKKDKPGNKIPEDAVDLGIVMTREDGTTYKLYWAKSNLCETGLCANPEDYGDYYAWGETEPYYTEGHSQDNPCSNWRSRTNPTITGYNWASYKWCNRSPAVLTKYNTNIASGGIVDNITELQRGEKEGETVDDAARAKLGGKWRMPTKAEWNALLALSCGRTTINGIEGRLVTAENGNSIFLPAAGSRNDTYLYNAGSYGYYWSSSLNDVNYTEAARCVLFYSDNILINNSFRSDGLSVRPVWEE